METKKTMFKALMLISTTLLIVSLIIAIVMFATWFDETRNTRLLEQKATCAGALIAAKGMMRPVASLSKQQGMFTVLPTLYARGNSG